MSPRCAGRRTDEVIQTESFDSFFDLPCDSEPVIRERIRAVVHYLVSFRRSDAGERKLHLRLRLKM